MVCRWGDPEHHWFPRGNCDPRWSPSPGPTQPQPFGPQICAASSSLGNPLHEAVDWKGQTQPLKWYCNNCGHYTSVGFAGSRARPHHMVTWTFHSCFLTCVAVLTIACAHEKSRQQMDGEHSQIINFSQSAWIELPALACFPLLLFSNAVLYHKEFLF